MKHSLDRLWAPWRMKFITETDTKRCIFCALPQEKADAKNLIVKRGEHTCIILNRFPYNNGHVMIAPYRHIRHLRQLRAAEHGEMFTFLAQLETAMNTILKPDGFNIGMNVGKAAGAGYAHHLHMHMVPRWVGDTNFFPVLSSTKVISESLKEFYRRLKKELAG